MKTATVRDLRNHYSKLLAWISAGEEVVITRRGKSIARLSPEPPTDGAEKVDWSQSAAVGRDRTQEKVLRAAESARLIKESGGKW